MRGYLGNSARARVKDGPRQPRDNNNNNPNNNNNNNGKRSRRNKGPGGPGGMGMGMGGGGMRDEFPDDEEFDVIPAAELELTKNAMNLSELKTRPPAELVQLGESMGLENLARSRKQDIIFLILKAHAQQRRGHLRRRRARDPAGRLRLPARPDGSYLAGPDDIYVARARSAASTCAPATPSPGSSARRRKASAISRCSRSTTSTATRRRARRTRCCSRT